MCAELYDLYEQFSIKCSRIVASGGAVRKNEALKLMLKDTFLMSVDESTLKEEAATGAALFSALAVGKIEYKNGFLDYLEC